MKPCPFLCQLRRQTCQKEESKPTERPLTFIALSVILYKKSANMANSLVPLLLVARLGTSIPFHRSTFGHPTIDKTGHEYNNSVGQASIVSCASVVQQPLSAASANTTNQPAV